MMEIDSGNIKFDKLISEASDVVRHIVSEKDNAIKELEECKRKNLEIIAMVLRSKIGQNIYWAHKDWRKYETHIISDVEVSVVDTDFWGKEYYHQPTVKIHLEDGGFYISQLLNYTLFFDEAEADSHTYKG